MAIADASRQITGEKKLLNFFGNQLNNIYCAEELFVRFVILMQAAATAPKLKEALTRHHEQTKQRIKRLEQIFKLLEMPRQQENCKVMEAITEEGLETIEKTDPASATRDITIIFTTQKAEYYEVANYNSLLRLSYILNLEDVSFILNLTLSEEKESYETLTKIAENDIYGAVYREMSF